MSVWFGEEIQALLWQERQTKLGITMERCEAQLVCEGKGEAVAIVTYITSPRPARWYEEDKDIEIRVTVLVCAGCLQWLRKSYRYKIEEELSV